MPSIKASQNVNMQGWKPDTAPVQQPAVKSSAPSNQTRPPFMLSSMPLMASTNDALNQFYNGSIIPSFRTLPFFRGGATQ